MIRPVPSCKMLMLPHSVLVGYVHNSWCFCCDWHGEDGMVRAMRVHYHTICNDVGDLAGYIMDCIVTITDDIWEFGIERQYPGTLRELSYHFAMTCDYHILIKYFRYPNNGWPYYPCCAKGNGE